jgi:hypothetical protein
MGEYINRGANMATVTVIPEKVYKNPPKTHAELRRRQKERFNSLTDVEKCKEQIEHYHRSLVFFKS